METREISEHEVRIYITLKTDNHWLSSKEVSEKANVAPRTARLHLRKLATLGLVDAAAIFPAHRYKLSTKTNKQNVAYLRRLEQAQMIIGQGGNSHVA